MHRLPFVLQSHKDRPRKRAFTDNTCSISFVTHTGQVIFGFGNRFLKKIVDSVDQRASKVCGHRDQYDQEKIDNAIEPECACMATDGREQ